MTRGLASFLVLRHRWIDQRLVLDVLDGELMYSGHRMQFLQGRHCGGRQLDRRGWRPQHKGCNRNQGNNRDRINSSGASWTSPSPTSLNRTCRDHCPEVSAALTTVGFDQSGSRWLGTSDLIAEPEGPTFISYKVARSRLDRLRFVIQDPTRK